MAKKIKVLIVDDVQATRENIRKLMEFDPDVAAVDQAASGDEAVEKAKTHRPDVILMDINMAGMDGITATGLLTTELPGSAIIIMSVQGEQEYLRRAMNAGAKDYLIKPFTGDELLQAVKQVYNNEQQRRKVVTLDPRANEPGTVLTVFSAKGGIGKTTIAVNLAVALAAKTRERVAVVDADLQFGDVCLFLNLSPRATIADLVQDVENLDDKVLAGYMSRYNDQVDVLPAPLRPEQADTVSGAALAAILKALRASYRYVIVDTAPSFNDTILAALDEADQILLVSSLDLPTIKNVKVCLEIMESLSYTQEKIMVILNRSDGEGGMDSREVEESLRYPFMAKLPSDGRTVVTSVNRGVPFVVSNPESGVAQHIFQLARTIASGSWREEAPRSMVNRFKRLFG